MGLLEELQTYLVAQGVGVADATKDWAIAIKRMPEIKNAVGCIYETGGSSPFLGLGATVPDRVFPSIQVRFRGEPDDYDTPRAKCRLAYDALVAIRTQTALSGTNYYLITALQEPFPMGGRDEDNRWNIVCNFNIEKDLS